MSNAFFDYGVNEGIFRTLDVFDKYDMHTSRRCAMSSISLVKKLERAAE